MISQCMFISPRAALLFGKYTSICLFPLLMKYLKVLCIYCQYRDDPLQDNFFIILLALLHSPDHTII